MYDNLPEWLKKPPIFCVCDETKKPKFPTKPNDLDTFFPFDEALARIEEGERLGIGIWGALCGIDIDKCIKEGVISEDAMDIIKLFPEAYIEYSPSHTGLHILFLSKAQYKDKDLYFTKPSQKFLQSLNLTGMKGLEFYQGMTDHRYFTVTGDVYQQQPDKIFIDGDRIQSFLDTYMKRPIPTQSSSLVSVTTDDEEDMAWYKFTKFLYNNLPFRNEFPSIEKLHELLERTPTGSGGTESEDDLSLLANLAFWCNHNPRVMRYAFEHSAYYNKKDAKHKKKWARQDYSEGAITRATQNVNVAKIYFKDFFKYIPENKTMDFSGFLAHVKKGDGPMVYAVQDKQDRYTYKDTNNIRYTAQIKYLKSGKLYVAWINAYDCTKKESLGFLDIRDIEGNYNKKFFEVANHFLKNIK